MSPLPQHCTLPAHDKATLPLSLLLLPWLSPLRSPLPSPLPLLTPLLLPSVAHRILPLPSANAVPVAVDHCRRRLCCFAISHCCCRCPHRQPLSSLLLSAIAVAISVSHHRPCRLQPLLRVVVLVQQELYSNNLSKECLPYFILFGQWGVH